MKSDIRGVIGLVQERRKTTLQRLEDEGFVYYGTRGENEIYFNQQVRIVYDPVNDIITNATLRGRT